MRRRVFNICQYDINPKTGETLITEEQIQKALRHMSFKQWAYIHHDKDVWTQADEQKDPNKKAGSPKPPHWHIVIRCDQAIEHKKVAEWFGVPENFVDLPSGKYAFQDCLVYLTHVDDKQIKAGKTVYDASEVKTSFGFNYSETVDESIENRIRFGHDLNKTEKMYHEILFDGLTLKQAADKYPYEYMMNIDKAEKYRRQFVARYQKMPGSRINIYVEGPGGEGKSTLCRWLAQSILNRDGKFEDDDVFVRIGAKKSPLEAYEGQPCIIWDDCRADGLIDRLGGRDEVFKVFDTFPQDQRENVKYSSVTLKNSINIVNSVQPWTDFVNCLSGEEEDKDQVRRRFPIFIIIHEEDYDMILNRGVYEETREYGQYVRIKQISGSVRKLVQAVPPERKELLDETTLKLVEPVRKKVEELEDILDKDSRDERTDEDEWNSRFANVGETENDPENVSFDDILRERPSSEPEQESWLGEDSEDDPFDDCPFPLGGDDE